MNSTWLDILAIPMGKFLKLIYDFLYTAHVPGSYGIAIIILTFIVRGLILPLYLKQIESSLKMVEIAPRLKDIQEKYKDNQQKIQEEILNLYHETRYNPTCGCLPLLIQIPILFSLYYVFQNPLVYVLGKTHQYVKELLHDVNGNIATEMIIQEAERLGLDMHFFGINLAQKDLVFLPILSALFSMLSIMYSMNSQQKFNPQYSPSIFSDRIKHNKRIYK